MMSKYRVDFEAIDWESPIRGMRQKIYKLGHQQLRMVEYSRELPAHWCEKGHIGYVLQGQIDIEFAHERQVYSSGDGVFIPNGPEHKHKGTVISDTVTIVFVEDV
jgi:hypothetical protein